MKDKNSSRLILPGSMLAGGLALVILSGHIFLPLNIDNDTYQSMGLALAREGKLPYLGSWDQNFPGIILLHAAAILLFGNSAIAFQLLTITLSTLTAILFYSIMRTWFSHRVSLLTAILYALFYLHAGYEVNGQRDVFVALCFLVSFWSIRAAVRGTNFSWLYFIAGVASGYAVFIRPTYGLAFLVVAAGCYLVSNRLRTVTFFMVGGAIPIIVFLIPYIFHSGGLREVYYSTIRFNLDVYGPHPGMPDEPFLALFKHALLLGLSLTGLLIFRKNASISGDVIRRPQRSEQGLYFGFLAALLLSPIVMGKYGTVRFFPFLSALIPPAAVGMVELFSIARSAFSNRMMLHRSFPTLGVLLLALVSGRMMNRDPIARFFRSLGSPSPYDSAQTAYVTWQRGAVEPECNPHINKQVCEYIDRHVAAHEPVETCSQALRWMMDRPSVTRFPTYVPLTMKTPDGKHTYYQQRWRAEYVDSLTSAKPAYIILMGGNRSDLFFLDDLPINLAKSLPGFSELLDQNYRLDTVIDVFILYRRK